MVRPEIDTTSFTVYAAPLMFAVVDPVKLPVVELDTVIVMLKLKVTPALTCVFTQVPTPELLTVRTPEIVAVGLKTHVFVVADPLPV